MDISPLSGTPVAGDGDVSDPTRAEHALGEFYRALNGRDLDLMAANWDDGEAAAMDNPLGGIVRGWDAIAAVYRRLFASQGRYRFEFHDYQLYGAAEVFFVIGRERGWLEGGTGRLELAIRTTRIFARRPARWRQIHHHGSIDDPDMLRRYLDAVGGASGTDA